VEFKSEHVYIDKQVSGTVYFVRPFASRVRANKKLELLA
jgi:hypothetical protein